MMIEVGPRHLENLMQMQAPGYVRPEPGQVEQPLRIHRRELVAMAVMLSGLLMTGCADKPSAVPRDRYCYRAHRRSGSRATCTPGPIPDAAVDAQAKRFEPVPGKLTVYLVRNRWGDAVNMVFVGISGGRMVPTVPASYVRFVMTPGPHRLVFQWEKGNGELDVHGEAGRLLFVDLVGSLWFWNERYRLDHGDQHSQERTLKSRLVADVDGDARE